MKSKVVNMGASNEPYEDLTEHIVIMCDREFLMQSNLRVYQPVELTNGTSAETLAKARAVLDLHREAVEYSREKVAIAEATWLPLPATLKALVALADALEGGGDA